MANPTADVPAYVVPGNLETIQRGLDSVAQSYYQFEAVGLAASGFVQKCDDTQPILFDGLVNNAGPLTVNVGDAAGAKLVEILRPRFFSMKITTVTPQNTDVGRAVYARFSNECQYAPGNYGNYLGTVWEVRTAVDVMIAPMPWVRQVSFGIFSLAATGNQTLSFLHANKTIEAPITANLTCTLPPVAAVSAGDTIDFVKTTSNAAVLTLQGSGADNINGANTFALNTAQFSTAVLRCDGTQWLVMAKI